MSNYSQQNVNKGYSKLRIAISALLVTFVFLVFMVGEQALKNRYTAEKQDTYRQFVTSSIQEYWDEQEYLSKYKDVSDAIQTGAFSENGLFHFLNYGLQEGRFPAISDPAKKIQESTKRLFDRYLNYKKGPFPNANREILSIMNWFSSIAIKCYRNGEIEFARRQRTSVRKLYLHEMIYLLKTDQYAMLCGNYAHFFTEILRELGYDASSYNTGYLNTNTHVVTLIRKENEEDFFVWDSFYNYYIADEQGNPIELSKIYEQLNAFYTHGDIPTFQIVYGDIEYEKQLNYLPTFPGEPDLAILGALQPTPQTLPDPHHFIFTSNPKDKKNHLSDRVPMFTIPHLKADQFIANFLALPLESHDQKLTESLLTNYPQLTRQIQESLRENHPDYFVNETKSL